MFINYIVLIRGFVTSKKRRDLGIGEVDLAVSGAVTGTLGATVARAGRTLAAGTGVGGGGVLHSGLIAVALHRRLLATRASSLGGTDTGRSRASHYD